MANRHLICLSVLMPMVLCACATPQPAASNVAESLVYSDADTAEVDEIREEAAEVDLASQRDDEEVVCRREQKTGSHMRRVVCRTARERAAMRESSQDWLRSGGVEGSPVVAR